LILAAALIPAEAACGGNPLIATRSGPGTSASFIWTDGWDVGYFAGYPPYSASGIVPFSANATATFWALGAGNPTVGVGIDAGTWTQPPAAWMYYNNTYFGGWYAAEIFAGWGRDAGIDGCIQDFPAGICDCVLMTDQDGSTGYFAMLSKETDALWNAFLTQPGNDGAGNFAPIIMMPIPAPFVTNSVAVGADLQITSTVAMPTDGIYQSGGACACGPTGFKVMIATGAAAPASRDVAAWTEATLVGGGLQDWNAMGASVAVQTPLCEGTGDGVWLTTLLQFDSGFVSPVVSGDSTQISCDPTLADPVDVKPRFRRGTQVPVRTPTRDR
jgi:hypothetical protein